MTDPLGQITLFVYDPLDRRTQISDANGVTKFSYDGNGNLLRKLCAVLLSF